MRLQRPLLPLRHLALPGVILGLFCASFARGLSCQDGERGQEPSKSWKSKDPFQGRNKGKFSILRDAELSIRLAESKRLLREGKRRAAVEALLAVLEAGPAFVDEVDEAGEGAFVGLRESARLELGKLDAKGRDIYQALVRGELEAPVKDALLRRDESALSRLASRFPYTDSGERARLAAGDLALERGDFLSALQAYSLFDGQDRNSRVQFRKLLCRHLLDLPIDWEANRDMKAPDGSGLEDWLDRSFRGQLYGDSKSYWPAYGGGLEGSRLQGEATRPNDPAWSRSLTGIGNIQYNMHAVTDGRKVFVNTGTVVEGLDLWTGRGWQQRSPILEHPERQEFEWATNIRHILSCALGQGVLVAPLQMPIKTDEGSERISFRGIPIMARLPVRRLFAFDAETGKLLWSHAENLGNAPIDTCGPPTIIGDRIYVPTHRLVGGISYYVSAFDLHTGKLIWKTLLLSSQIEVNMFGNAQWEFSASPLAFADGVIYGCTNLGAAFSLRCDDGSIRWLREYDVTYQPRTRMYVEERTVYWGNNPPLVSDGVCVFTPLDSKHAIALDTETGRLNWRVESFVRRAQNLAESPEVFWMLGIADGYVYFQGHALTRVPIRAKRRFRSLSHELIVPPASMGMRHHPDRKLIPRGVLTKKHIYVPVGRQSIAIFDHEGRLVTSKRRASEPREIGNLLISKDILFSLRCPRSNSIQLDAYFSHADLLSRARQRTQTHPRSAEAWLDLSELLVSDPRSHDENLEEARLGFETALSNLKLEGERAKLGGRARRGLFETRRQLAIQSYPVDRKVAFAHYLACLALGRRLATEDHSEVRLIKLMVDLLNRYPEKRVFRESILRELSENHGDRRINFPKLGRVPVGLYVILARLSGMPRNRSSASARLALLRRMLLDYGSILIDRESARSIAIEKSRSLLEKYGRDVYSDIEREARSLLEVASDDPAKLRQVLERFPLSDTARFALIHLARAAASRGDLATCLDTWDLALTRLDGLPKELPPAMAKAARARGNLGLAAAFDALASGKARVLHHLALPETVRASTLVELSDALPLEGRGGAGSRSMLFLPKRISGFLGSDKALPLLLHDEQNQLLGFQPGEKGRGFDFSRPFFRLHYQRDLSYSLEACIQGRILVLPDRLKIRAYDLDRGRLLWTHQVRGGRGKEEARSHIMASGPLRTGLYAWVSSMADGDRRYLQYEAREVLTGRPVFRVRLQGLGEYDDLEFREGFFFHLSSNLEGTGRRLVLRDGLTGRIRQVFDFDGTHLPDMDPPPTGILFTERELFFLGSPGGDSRHRLYAYDLEGKHLWTSEEQSLRARDIYRVLREQVFLTARFGHNAIEGRAMFLNRLTGKVQRKIQIGFDALLPGQSHEPAIHDEGPFVMRGRNQNGTSNLYYLDPDPSKSSWVAPLRWGPRAALVPGSPVLGESFLCMARYRRRAERGIVDLRLFDRKTGESMRGPASKAIPSTVAIAAWNGQLLMHGRMDHTWVYADRIGK